MTVSIARRFTGAVGPAFDADDLALILGSGDRRTFASASSHHGLTAAAKSVISMIRRESDPQAVIGFAALLQAPSARLLGAVRSLTGLLRSAYSCDIDLVVGGMALDEKAGDLKVTVSIWVRMR
jgi:hypothetical protein